MAITSFSLLLLSLSLLFSSFQSKSQPHLTPSPYLSPTTLLPNYQKMLQTFKIFTYTPQTPTQLHSLFHSSLLTSPFVTRNPNEAHLFFVPFASNISTRSLARVIRTLRTDFPYWNRTLGADHFYVSCSGISGLESDRNLVELKKNSVQISCFPAPFGKFVPHKDVTLPPLTPNFSPAPSPNNSTAKKLGYFRFSTIKSASSLIDELNGDPEFLIESSPSDETTHLENLSTSKFCLFVYDGDVSRIGEALMLGCVPAVISDRPIQDLPLMDVVKWSRIAVFVGGVKDVKRVLGTYGEGKYEMMREEGANVVGKHFVWNEEPQPYDAFHMVMYQMWLRRHTIRYTRADSF